MRIFGVLRWPAAPVLAFGMSALPAQGQTVLFEYALNRDGVVGTALPAGSSLDLGTGLGMLTLKFETPGVHYAGFFVDHELDEKLNTFFNELGSISLETLPVGLSWEIDEPGFAGGDIVAHFAAGQLDKSVGGSEPEDVSLALGWEFRLAAGQSAEITFLLTDDRGALGAGFFYLQHQDLDSGASVYFTSSVRIQGNRVPEGKVGLWGIASVGFAYGLVRRRTR